MDLKRPWLDKFFLSTYTARAYTAKR